MKPFSLLFFIFPVLLVFDCQQSGANFEIYQLPALTETGVRAIIEIPAGSNHKFEYNPDTGKFEVEQIEGKDRIVHFLPYPGNYGFIPSTLMDLEEGGDGDALDILVIGESQATATILDVKPIATLLLKDNGEIDTKIIAIPTEVEQQVLKIKDFQEFLIKHDAAKSIIENWFLNYKGFGKTELIGWQDETYAMNEIKKWIKK